MTAHLDKLLSPPQQVMDRARTAQQTSLLVRRHVTAL